MKNKEKVFLQGAKEVINNGYKVYVPNLRGWLREYTYGNVVNKDGIIGQFGVSDLDGFYYCTKHKPASGIGTGFMITEEPYYTMEKFSMQGVLQTFQVVPEHISRDARRKAVKVEKWHIDEWLKSDRVGGGKDWHELTLQEIEERTTKTA